MAARTDNFLIRHATAVALFAIALLTVMAAAMFKRQDEARQTTKGLLVHSYEVTGHIQLLFNRLKDVELGQRGYLIAGDEQYLAPYRDALKNSFGDDANSDRLDQHHSLAEELAILRKLTRDNPAQQQNLDEMAADIKDLLDYWSAKINERHATEGEAAEAASRFQHGNQLMDHVRRLVGIMMAEENHLLEIRTQADEASTRASNVLTYAGLAVFAFILALAVWLYQRSRHLYTQELEQNEAQLTLQQEELQTTNGALAETARALEEQNAQIQQQSEELTESYHLVEEKIGELERANTYKSEFLANMSHELRTPLNSMLILAKMLAANEDGNMTDEQAEEARIIHNGGLELLTLINDILDLSKVEAGKLVFKAEDVYLEDIVAGLRQQFMPVAQQAKLQFTVTCADHLPPVLHTDAQRVEQILKNLLANAFKFTQKGSVTLEIFYPDEQLTLRSGASGGSSDASSDISSGKVRSIAFAVVDTGIGIDAGKFRDIFEAFQQEDGSIDRHYGGTGLGLTIARKFAHTLGGEIHVASDKGKGSRFTLVLPVQSNLATTEGATAPGRNRELR